MAIHHPFTAPRPDDWASGDLTGARAIAYDLVYNGVEVRACRTALARCTAGPETYGIGGVYGRAGFIFRSQGDSIQTAVHLITILVTPIFS